LGEALVKSGLGDALVQKLEKGKIEDKKSDDPDPEQPLEYSYDKTKNGIKPNNIKPLEHFTEIHSYPGK